MQEQISYLLEHELKGLCVNCTLSSSCSYRKATDKIIIQCELYQLGEVEEVPGLLAIQKGLCSNCEREDTCQLSARHTGIWHCQEYV